MIGIRHIHRHSLHTLGEYYYNNVASKWKLRNAAQDTKGTIRTQWAN